VLGRILSGYSGHLADFVKAEVDKQLTLNQKELCNLSVKVNSILEGQEGKWTEVVKKLVNKSLGFVSDNT